MVPLSSICNVPEPGTPALRFPQVKIPGLAPGAMTPELPAKLTDPIVPFPWRVALLTVTALALAYHQLAADLH